MIKPLLFDTPDAAYPRIAQEVFESSPEALKLKRQANVAQTLRQAKLQKQLSEIFNDPTLTGAEKLEAKRKLDSQARIADATDTATAQYNAAREEALGRAQKDLAGMPTVDRYYRREINYNPGIRFEGDLSMSPDELIRTSKQLATFHGQPFTTEQEVAALRARMPGGKHSPAQLIPKDLADRYSAETQAELSAFDQKAKAEEDSLLQARRASAQRQARIAAEVQRERSKAGVFIGPGGSPAIPESSWGLMLNFAQPQKPDNVIIRGGGPLPTDDAYGMQPEDFVAPRSNGGIWPAPVPSHPTLPNRARRASAALFP